MSILALKVMPTQLNLQNVQLMGVFTKCARFYCAFFRYRNPIRSTNSLINSKAMKSTPIVINYHERILLCVHYFLVMHFRRYEQF